MKKHPSAVVIPPIARIALNIGLFFTYSALLYFSICFCVGFVSGLIGQLAWMDDTTLTDTVFAILFIVSMIIMGIVSFFMVKTLYLHTEQE